MYTKDNSETVYAWKSLKWSSGVGCLVDVLASASAGPPLTCHLLRHGRSTRLSKRRISGPRVRTSARYIAGVESSARRNAVSGGPSRLQRSSSSAPKAAEKHVVETTGLLSALSILTVRAFVKGDGRDDPTAGGVGGRGPSERTRRPEWRYRFRSSAGCTAFCASCSSSQAVRGCVEGAKRGHSDEERRPSAEDKRAVDSFWRCSDRVQEIEQSSLNLVLRVC